MASGETRCMHEPTWVDAGPWSDDIGYRVCKKCGVSMEAEPATPSERQKEECVQPCRHCGKPGKKDETTGAIIHAAKSDFTMCGQAFSPANPSVDTPTREQRLAEALRNLHTAVWKNCGKVRLLKMQAELEAADDLLETK